MGFVGDLKQGEEYEKDMVEKIHKEFGLLLMKNNDKKGVDLIHPLLNAEVKFDRMMDSTGNLFVEIGYKGGESGLFKDDDADLYIHGNKSFAFVFKTRKLREQLLEGVADGKFRSVNGGDGWKSKGVLLPIECAEEMCQYKLEMQKEL